MVKEWNRDGGTVWGTVEQSWLNSVVEQWNSNDGTVIVEQCCGKVEQRWWNSGTVLMEH